MNIKKNDTVLIISGKDKGKKGKILQVLPGINKVVVEGVNMLAKNVRPKKRGEKGQVVRYNAPLNASKVQVFCSSCGKGVRLGFKFDKAGKKVRICKKCKQAI